VPFGGGIAIPEKVGRMQKAKKGVQIVVVNFVILLGSGLVSPPHHCSGDPQQEVKFPYFVTREDGKKITLERGMPYKEVFRNLAPFSSTAFGGSQTITIYAEYLELTFNSNGLISIRHLKWDWENEKL
jgi:hypothetical protein